MNVNSLTNKQTSVVRASKGNRQAIGENTNPQSL